MASECDTCIPCHGSIEDIHGDINHSAEPGSGQVVIFPDNAHDSAGWTGDKPYFDVTVECNVCHASDLPAVHGQDCETCHPSPYDTLGQLWNKGCQQGGCHPFYHQDSSKAHLPFEDPYQGPGENDCDRCHLPYAGAVVQANCLNCHASYGVSDVSPPVTSANLLNEYVGPAKIDFSITDNGGKVGLGRTFYSLDSGPVIAAGKNLLVTAPGSHNLEFWSMDQSGNTEAAPTYATFNIVADTTPPTTSSDAQASYSEGAVVTLTATDASTLGVKNTYYRLNGGASYVGTRVTIPAVNGNYTLAYWSEDWSGNIEAENSVNFTVTVTPVNYGTLKLVWGDSDASGSPCGIDPDAQANWVVKNGTNTVATGAGICPDWSGVDSLVVPTSSTRYLIIINWWDSYNEDWEQTTFAVDVTVPGQEIRLSY
ncbi:MAG: hypothetical protein P8X63_03215 [Desulfuromonadaceae bacterium]